MELATSAKFHHLRTGKPLPVLRASAFADKRVFDNSPRQTTEWMDLLPPAIHGQVLCIQNALTLQPRNRLTEIQKATEGSIGEVVNSARVKLGMSPIVPNASFIKRWGLGHLSDEERAAFRENQLEKLAKGRETQRIIRELAASGDPKAQEWVANERRGQEKGHEAQANIRKQAAAGDAKAKEWVANKRQAQRDSLRETQSEIRKQAAAGNETAIAWQKKQLGNLNRGNSTGAKNQHNKAVAKAKRRVRQLAREGQFILGSNGTILYQKHGENKTTPLTTKTCKELEISQPQVKTAKKEVWEEIWKETASPFFNEEN
jgi:hypothetical protein